MTNPVPVPADRARDRPQRGRLAKSAFRTILTNPRCTRRQVWNKRRRTTILLDVNDVATGYETRIRWNETDRWADPTPSPTNR